MTLPPLTVGRGGARSQYQARQKRGHLPASAHWVRSATGGCWRTGRRGQCNHVGPWRRPCAPRIGRRTTTGPASPALSRRFPRGREGSSGWRGFRRQKSGRGTTRQSGQQWPHRMKFDEDIHAVTHGSADFVERFQCAAQVEGRGMLAPRCLGGAGEIGMGGDHRVAGGLGGSAFSADGPGLPGYARKRPDQPAIDRYGGKWPRSYRRQVQCCSHASTAAFKPVGQVVLFWQFGLRHPAWQHNRPAAEFAAWRMKS